MNKVINDLNDLHSYEDSVTYLNNELKWNIEDEAVADFIKLLENASSKQCDNGQLTMYLSLSF